jgi:RNA polymerase sigma factor (TIGR02999 family)
VGSSVRSVTELLREWRGGDRAALDQMMPLVYAELHRLAEGFMRGQRAGHTLRPTALVAEAYEKLAGAAPDLNDRVHFFAVAARVMRQILVDYARERAASKRGDGERPVTLDEGVVAGDRPGELLDLDRALDELAKFDARRARAVELHYFGGLTHEEVAEVLEVHVNTVARDLRLAEAWIHSRLREPG